MGSNQNPIHRDRDKRGKGAQPYQDDKEAFSQSQADIQGSAPFDENEAAGLSEEELDQLRRQAASERLAEVQREVSDEDNSQ